MLYFFKHYLSCKNVFERLNKLCIEQGYHRKSRRIVQIANH
jgi:hypothetical protein